MIVKPDTDLEDYVGVQNGQVANLAPVASVVVDKGVIETSQLAEMTDAEFRAHSGKL